MIRACVIGWPIEHSRSPLIHGHWLTTYRIDGSYGKTAVQPEAAADFLRSLSSNGLAGCNVTVPLKEIAFATAGRIEDSALAVKAANTIWLEDAVICAANTDTYGFMTHLELTAPGWQNSASPVAILGAGGAARAIAYGFQQAGVEEIVIFNRTRERAEALCQDLGKGLRTADWSKRANCADWACVVVNTTTIGMKGAGHLGLDFASARPDCVVADIVYVPLETSLLKDAHAHGLRTVDGLGMLLHQAVPGFERWFGVRPEVTPALRRVVLDDLGAQ
ncbi:MAG: shikimate dehydrogenase [Alphaproteobacteria bacterium]|nr:shikimate dehydrogenase [Alphaproteobacteria bacterium]